jgi:ATP-dependent Clp protease protease subunit
MIEKTLDRDYFMTADQAKDFGIIDRVLNKRDDVDPGTGEAKTS